MLYLEIYMLKGICVRIYKLFQFFEQVNYFEDDV